MKLPSLFRKRVETVTKAEHERALGLIKALEHDVLVYQRRIGRLTAELTAANIDAEKYRRSRANLKQFRKAG